MATRPPADVTALEALQATIRGRLNADPEQSYVARLHHKGLDAILKKVGEETTDRSEAPRKRRQDQLQRARPGISTERGARLINEYSVIAASHFDCKAVTHAALNTDGLHVVMSLRKEL